MFQHGGRQAAQEAADEQGAGGGGMLAASNRGQLPGRGVIGFIHRGQEFAVLEDRELLAGLILQQGQAPVPGVLHLEEGMAGKPVAPRALFRPAVQRQGRGRQHYHCQQAAAYGQGSLSLDPEE